MLTSQVAWLYWPEELPPPPVRAADQLSKDSGKRRYHGSHELIASNYMDVLDVLSFAGKAEVHHWLEEDDNLQHKLYWRQTFCRETQALSVSSVFAQRKKEGHADYTTDTTTTLHMQRILQSRSYDVHLRQSVLQDLAA